MHFIISTYFHLILYIIPVLMSIIFLIFLNDLFTERAWRYLLQQSQLLCDSYRIIWDLKWVHLDPKPISSLLHRGITLLLLHRGKVIPLCNKFVRNPFLTLINSFIITVLLLLLYSVCKGIVTKA